MNWILISYFSLFFSVFGLAAVPTKETIFFSSREFSQIGADNFAAFAQYATSSKKFRVVIQEPGFSKMSTRSSGIEANGTFLFMVGLNYNSEGNELMRSGDYKALYGVFTYLAKLRIKVEINLAATTGDLSDALSRTTPTSIAWVSHGNDDVFFDAASIPIPFNIFQKASPSVYQFINGACRGRNSMNKSYKLPASLRNWGWTEDVFHPSQFTSFLFSDDWSIWLNHPGIVKDGVACLGSEGKYSITQSSTGSRVIEETSWGRCLENMADIQNGLICVTFSDGTDTVSLKTLKRSGALAYDKFEECVVRIRTAQNGRVCRLYPDQKARVFYGNEKINPKQPSYSSVDECMQELRSTTEI